jgi:threonine dehydrogenase-like Zn-dependent dehydrogenase
VGLSAVLAAKQMGATTVILMGRHTARTDLGREFGATHVVAERGNEGIAKVMEITGARAPTWCRRPSKHAQRSDPEAVISLEMPCRASCLAAALARIR